MGRRAYKDTPSGEPLLQAACAPWTAVNGTVDETKSKDEDCSTQGGVKLVTPELLLRPAEELVGAVASDRPQLVLECL